MKKPIKVFLYSLLTVLLLGAAFVYTAFFGTPWDKWKHKRYASAYLAQQYEEPMVVERGYFNFKDGRYGAIAHPADLPEVQFHVTQSWIPGRAYHDYYPEKLWEYQAKQDLQPLIEKHYPEVSTYGVSYVMGESAEQNVSGKVPDYRETQSFCTIFIDSGRDFDKSSLKQEAERMYPFIRFVQSNKLNAEILFRFKGPADTKDDSYVRFTADDITQITSVEELAKRLPAR